MIFYTLHIPCLIFLYGPTLCQHNGEVFSNVFDYSLFFVNDLLFIFLCILFRIGTKLSCGFFVFSTFGWIFGLILVCFILTWQWDHILNTKNFANSLSRTTHWITCNTFYVTFNSDWLSFHYCTHLFTTLCGM